MHLALKSAMSRIPYTNKVGETIGSIADPAAAYSLRALNGGDPMVARVRRSSDDAEKDFTASDMDSGSVADWVNGKQDTTLPCDVASAAAAYSLRSVNSNYAGSAVRVRRSSDDAEKDFTASDVSGSVLVDWVGSGNDGYVTIWYDQSGNSLDLVNLESTTQPKIVESGVFLNALDFLKADTTYKGTFTLANKVNGSYQSTSLSIQQLNFFSVFARSDTSPTQSSKHINFVHEPGGLFRSAHITPYSPRTYERYFGGATVLSDSISINEDGSNNIISAINQTTSEGGSSLHINGSEVSLGTTNVSGQINFSKFAGPSIFNSHINQTVSEFIIYDSDQSANRTAIETNINNYYDIY